MPLILILRFLFGLLSLAILGLAAYLLWRWYDGTLLRDSVGLVYRVREDWLLWVGLGALVWSSAGGMLLRPMLARPDKRVLKPTKADGQTITSPSGSSLYLETHGDPRAPCIVLTHGWGLDSSIWSYAIEDLAKSFHVMAWDLPGLGRSNGKVDLETFAEDLRTVAAQSPTQPVVLVGHSIGGMTIQTLARRDPAFVERSVAGIILVNTTYTNPLQTMILSPLWKLLRWPLIEPLLWLTIALEPLAWLWSWQSYLSGSAHLANRLGFGKHVTRSQLNVTTLLGVKNRPGALARGNLAMFRWDARDALSTTRVPILVIGGERDIVTQPKASARISESAPSSTLTIVDDVNHMGFLERHDVYNEAIADFATRTLAPAKPKVARRIA
jgi:pimeloyl-ACP methyl ester carboxylesterase